MVVKARVVITFMIFFYQHIFSQKILTVVSFSNCWNSCTYIHRLFSKTVCINVPQYGRGRFGNTWRRKRSWVFGMLEINSASRRPILRLVKKRNKNTLLPIIKKHVKRRSLVVSDEWRAYTSLSQEGYRHVRVNHSQSYVDPQTGLHTQHIERAWQTYKREIWRMRANRSESTLKKYLCFIEWTYWLARRYKHGVLGRLLKDIRNANH